MFTKNLPLRFLEQPKSVPFLGNMPGFKWLFTSSSAFSNSTELVLFLAPRLVDRHITKLNRNVWVRPR
ncbi:hypothetical protein [Pseudomonas sp. B28(2017)]|uniref:hypothetical protein n=1 Tax=Pseudomonas sp. B28(2017) TaxID=1981730 RepID=UPI00117A2EA4